eukprot:3066175-Pyramimonas_sp.AAC.1
MVTSKISSRITGYSLYLQRAAIEYSLTVPPVKATRTLTNADLPTEATLTEATLSGHFPGVGS